MNDSFLQDLELVPSEPKQPTPQSVNRNVTTRAVTSSPLQHLATSKLDNIIPKKPDTKQGNKDVVKDSRRISEPKKQTVKIKAPDKKDKPVETRLRPVENRVNIETKQLSPKEDVKVRTSDSRIKIGESKVLLGKERARRSGSYKENTLSSDASSKENNKPSDSSKDSTSNTDTKDKCKKCDSNSRKSDVRDKDPVALLNAIKELISTYTKQESTKILRAMQELHVNSQASLIKNLIFQTDDLIQGITVSNDGHRIKKLLQEKERLEQDAIFMQKRNEELLAKVEALKQENMALKMRCDKVLN